MNFFMHIVQIQIGFFSFEFQLNKSKRIMY